MHRRYLGSALSSNASNFVAAFVIAAALATGIFLSALLPYLASH